MSFAAADYLKKVRAASQVAFVDTSCGASCAILAEAERPHLASCDVAENPFTRADDLLSRHTDTLSKNYLSRIVIRQYSEQFWLAGKVLLVPMGYYFKS